MISLDWVITLFIYHPVEISFSKSSPDIHGVPLLAAKSVARDLQEPHCVEARATPRRVTHTHSSSLSFFFQKFPGRLSCLESGINEKRSSSLIGILHIKIIAMQWKENFYRQLFKDGLLFRMGPVWNQCFYFNEQGRNREINRAIDAAAECITRPPDRLVSVTRVQIFLRSIARHRPCRRGYLF